MPSVSALTSLLLLPAAILASYDCSHVRVDDQSFNLKQLGGPKDVHYAHRTSPTVSNTTFTIDICAPLKYPADTPKSEKCLGGTRVCGIERDYSGDAVSLRQVIPIAGEYHLSEGRKLDPKFTRIKDGKSNSESKKEGVIIEYHGGLHDSVPQMAIIEFQCDKEMEGTEGFDDKTKSLGATSIDIYGRMGKREDAEDDEDDGGEEDDSPLPDLDEGKALQYVSYESEKIDKKDVKVLRLNWKTRYACEGEAAKAPEGGKKTAGWGFFTWFLIIVFLLVASYIIFGSWLNYNRYGARGWDLLPHGDAIRDLPYLVKDWSGNVVDKLKGSGGDRGGYSAV